MRIQTKLLLACFCFLCYIYLGTGIYADELILTTSVPTWSLKQLLTLNYPNGPLYFFYNLPAYYLDFLEYYFFMDHFILYDIMKIIISFSAIYAFYFFAKDYMSKQNSLLLAAVFVLFPIHDAANYQLQNAQYLFTSFSLVMFSHALIYHGRIKSGLAAGLAGSFFSYASPPFVWGLSILFLLKKDTKKFIYFVFPQLLYISYILIMTKVIAVETLRTLDAGNLPKLIKQFVFQILTFADAGIGPSFWLKIYYSLGNLSGQSFVVGLILTCLFYNFFRTKNTFFDKKLFYAFSTVVFCAFAMYALTGNYPQIAFSLGNRVTVYGSLILSLLVVSLASINREIASLVFAIFIFTSLGISDHWKEWHDKQATIMHNIANNRELKEINLTEPFFVAFNLYSKLGHISHIDFFETNTVAFRIATGREYKVFPLSKRFYFDGVSLYNKKFGYSINVGDHIFVYDSESDRLLKIPSEEIQRYIITLPADNRHWVELVDNKFLKDLAVKLMPRLEYAL